MRHKLSLFAMVLTCLAVVAAPVKKKISSLEKGQEAVEYGQWDKALEYFNTALTETPDYAYAAYAGMASVKISQEKPQEAIDLMNKAFDKMGENVDQEYRAWCCAEMATAYTDTKDHKTALKYMEQACELHPEEPHYATERSVLLYVLKDRDNASAVAQHALDLGAEGEDAERAQIVIDACQERAKSAEYAAVVEDRVTNESDDATFPEFPGGRTAMRQFIQDNLNYPEEVVMNDITGTVIVECTFDAEGKMTAAKVTQELSPECDKEALRVCQAMPQFSPATYNGKPVESSMLIPIKFNP